MLVAIARRSSLQRFGLWIHDCQEPEKTTGPKEKDGAEPSS